MIFIIDRKDRRRDGHMNFYLVYRQLVIEAWQSRGGEGRGAKVRDVKRRSVNRVKRGKRVRDILSQYFLNSRH